MERNKNESNFRYGTLPGASAPLAIAYVPMQTSATPAYEAAEALSRGTLFPGLDLPFMNIVNDTQPVTPLVTDELELYLDTHADDKEAFSMYQTFLALRKEARCRYAEKYGPVDQSDMLGENSYSWLKDPWPWEYQSKTEG